MNTRKSLAKVFGPVLLLTATLALPIDTAQAKEHGRAAAHAQADQHQKQTKNKQKVQQRKLVQKQAEVRRQQTAHRQPVVRKQVVKKQVVRQQTARQVARQQALQRQAALDRQAALQRQQSLQRQRALQAQALSRQQALARQRALDRQRALQRQRQVYRSDGRYYAAPPVRRGGGADPNVFHVDGYLEAGGDCLFLHDHEGRTWAMVGNTYGLQPGEHVRLYGRPVDAGNACGYRAAAFDIYEVRTVWADNNHKRTYYDHLYDGPFDQNRAYEDDRYYNGQYDTYEDRQDRESWWDRIFGG